MKQFKPQPWFLPQPVIVLGTYDAQGNPNAMNVAWAGTWNMKEVMISMGNHATTANLKACGDFTIAFATVETMQAADYVGIVSAQNDPQKMARTGWHAERAQQVNAPLFTCFPVTFECRIKEKLNESPTGCFIIAEVLNIQVDENYLGDDGMPDIEKMQLITYDPVRHNYVALGKTVGKAFACGKSLQ